MFSTQYEATKKYLKKNKYMTSVHAGAPKNRVKEHQDALQAFWPGLQVLAGRLGSAVGQCWDFSIFVFVSSNDLLSTLLFGLAGHLGFWEELS